MSLKLSRGDTAKGSARPEKSHTGHLRREITALLLVKVVVLWGIWYVFFNEPQLKKMTEGMEPGRVAATLIASPKHRPEPNH